MSRVIVCGGREYHDYEKIIKSLNALHAKYPIDLLIEGGAKGADAHAATWADNNLIDRITVHANWKQRGNHAGPYRNNIMASKLSADYLVAFHGGCGTKNMIEAAKRHGIKVWVVEP